MTEPSDGKDDDNEDDIDDDNVSNHPSPLSSFIFQ